jgi:D-glycerate 3-kinase
MPEIVDDKSQHCIPFLLGRLQAHTERHRKPDGSADTPPFFLGLNGVQGAGKTVLVSRVLGLDCSSNLGTAGRPPRDVG